MSTWKIVRPDEAIVDHAQQEGTEKPADEPEPACFNCHRQSTVVPLLPVLRTGRSEWVCVHCLPGLIHG